MGKTRYSTIGKTNLGRTTTGRAYLERQTTERDTTLEEYAESFQLTLDGYRLRRPDYTEVQENTKGGTVNKKTIRDTIGIEPYPTDKQLYFIASRLGPGIKITSRTEASFIIDQMLKFPNEVMDCQRDAILEKRGVTIPNTQREAKILLMKLSKEYNGKRSQSDESTDKQPIKEGIDQQPG